MSQQIEDLTDRVFTAAQVAGWSVEEASWLWWIALKTADQPSKPVTWGDLLEIVAVREAELGAAPPGGHADLAAAIWQLLAEAREREAEEEVVVDDDASDE